jgi:DNA-binding response OmpR family regulator
VTARRIVVADDDPDIRDLLQLKLTGAGFDVHVADDGERALAQVEQFRPDLAVLDWMMPRRTGLEVCAELRSRADFASLPIILLTARAHQVDLEHGLACGADEYMTKPFSPREALVRVQALLARSRRLPGARSSSSCPDPAAS